MSGLHKAVPGQNCEGMRRRVAMGLLATSGMNVLDSARTSVDRVYNGSRPCLGRANEVALKQEESFTEF